MNYRNSIHLPERARAMPDTRMVLVSHCHKAFVRIISWGRGKVWYECAHCERPCGTIFIQDEKII